MASLSRRTLIACLAALSASSTLAQDAPYPSSRITLVVGYSAGGSVDLVARTG